MIDMIGESSSVHETNNVPVNYYYDRRFYYKKNRDTYHRIPKTFRDRSPEINIFPSVRKVGHWIGMAIDKITSGLVSH